MKKILSLILAIFIVASTVSFSAFAKDDNGRKAVSMNLMNAKNRVLNLTATEVTKSSITLSWDAVEGAAYYRIEKSMDNRETWSTSKTLSETSFTLLNRSSGTKYWFRVTALDSSRTELGKPSKVLKVQTLCSAPKISVSSSAPGSATVSITKVNGAIRYDIYKSLYRKKWVKVAETKSSKVTINNLSKGKQTYFKAVAVNWFENPSDFGAVKSVVVKSRYIFLKAKEVENNGYQSSTTTYTYDADGKLLRMECKSTKDNSNSAVYTYDKNGNLVKLVETAGGNGTRTTKHSYDSKNRVVKTEYKLVDGTTRVLTYAYDKNDNVTKKVDVINSKFTMTTTNTYNKNGDLLKSVMVDSDKDKTSIVNTYDSRGNLVKSVETMGDGAIMTTSFTFNAKGLVTKKTVSNGSGKITSSTTYAYNGNGNLISENEKDSYGRTIVSSYSYNADGNVSKKVVKISTGSSVITRTTCYDSKGRVTKEAETAPGSSIVITNSYSGGNLVKTVEKHSGGFSKTTEYKYDENKNLLGETWSASDGIKGFVNYSYKKIAV